MTEMLSLEIDEVRSLVLRLLQQRGVKPEHAEWIATDLVTAEVEGKRTHGLNKLLLIDELLAAKQGSPVVVRSEGAVSVIDARRELGQIAGRMALDEAISHAAKHGIGAVSVGNMARYARLAYLGELAAEAGYVAVIANDAGPAAVAPYGGIDPVLGTNAVCFAFPGNPPAIIDFATSEKPWGAIRQAVVAGQPLPEDAFIDASGRPTTDPDAADAVLPFGAAKGYALCVALELLCGGLLAGIVGTDVASEYDLGNLIIAIKPSAFGTSQMSRSVDRLRSQLANSRGTARMPGDRARSERTRAIGTRRVEVAPTLWSELKSMASGQSSQFGVSNRTN